MRVTGIQAIAPQHHRDVLKTTRLYVLPLGSIMLAIKKLVWRMRRPSLLSLMLLVALIAVSMVAVPKVIQWKKNRDRYLKSAQSFGYLRRIVRQSGNKETDPVIKGYADEVERCYRSLEKIHLEAAARPWRELPRSFTGPTCSKEQGRALAIRRSEIEQGSKPEILIDQLIRPTGAILPKSSSFLRR